MRNIALGAIQSMLDTMPNNAGGNFQDGVLTAISMHHEGARVGSKPQALLKRHEMKVVGAVHGHKMLQHAPDLD